jgi:DNA-binding protein
MRQHPIPQNVLDVEFKLFTKFTLKEFAYIATGVAIGAIFIYLWTENRMPGILAFPSFIFFSGIGLILGLVPIQDQPADRLLSNYVKAINRPTLRVWHGEEMKLRIKARESAGKVGIVEAQQAATKPVNLVDLDEEQKLKNLDQLMDETGLKQEQIPPSQQVITIAKANINNYILPNVKANLIGTLNLVLMNTQGEAIRDATVIVKDSFDKPRIAVKSGARGEVLTTQKLERGEYKIEIVHEQYKFRLIKFLVEDEVYPIIKITAL